MAALMRKNIFRNGAVSHSNSKNSAAQLVFYRGFTSKLFVKGVSFSTTKEMLADAFSQFGQVTEATIIMDKGENRSKGYEYVTFSTEEEAQKALADMNGKLLDGRVIFLDNVRPTKNMICRACLKKLDSRGCTYAKQKIKQRIAAAMAHG